MPREDFHSTDLEGAAYYAGIYGYSFDPADDRPSRVEADAECDLGRFELDGRMWDEMPAPVSLPVGSTRISVDGQLERIGCDRDRVPVRIREGAVPG